MGGGVQGGGSTSLAWSRDINGKAGCVGGEPSCAVVLPPWLAHLFQLSLSLSSLQDLVSVLAPLTMPSHWLSPNPTPDST